MFVFAAAVSTVSAIVFGLMPALKASRMDVSDALRAAAVGSRSRQASRGRDVLIVLQLALGLIVVAASGLVVQSSHALANAHPGFDPGDTLTARISTPTGPTFANRAAAQAYHTEIRRQLLALPGIAAVGAISQLPLTGQGPLQPYAYDAETARNWESVSADSRLLFATGGLSIVTWTAAAAIVCAVAVASSWLPAHRASGIDPQQGLRL